MRPAIASDRRNVSVSSDFVSTTKTLYGSIRQAGARGSRVTIYLLKRRSRAWDGAVDITAGLSGVVTAGATRVLMPPVYLSYIYESDRYSGYDQMGSLTSLNGMKMD